MVASDEQRRIEELETQVAFLEELHRRLDDTIALQDRDILELKRQVRVLAEKLEEIPEVPMPGNAPADEVPPHY